MASDAKGLLEAVQGRQKEKAVIAATELIHLLAFARERRANYLPSDPKVQLSIEHLQIISDSLASDGFPDDTQRMRKLLDRCHEIHNTLCRIAATVRRTLEEIE